MSEVCGEVWGGVRWDDGLIGGVVGWGDGLGRGEAVVFTYEYSWSGESSLYQYRGEDRIQSATSSPAHESFSQVAWRTRPSYLVGVP